ncbi:hypothetical protein DPMN_121932 [Dreissena polymorpha]|uniref:Uncharacterized protein n=1 Tax=Dreissena polymorpha TaxID=45954 RepID=A0A9D4JTM2_DREPO|nr:hypothetical protein DPMN_121932 [Dreissena polymorpha]
MAELISPNPTTPDPCNVINLANCMIRRSPWCNGYGGSLATGLVTGSIPTVVGVIFRSPPKTPSTGSRPRKCTRERSNKPEAFNVIELK